MHDNNGWEESDYDDGDYESCDACDGDGFYHDCGEDTCCCANPDEDDIWPCEECRGSGYYTVRGDR
jgi:hypothetical protein